jgi:predicted AlkP superfamily pyrophosphatase or phosphodiesterase
MFVHKMTRSVPDSSRQRIICRMTFALCVAINLFSAAAHAAPATHRMVIVISLDGFPAYALDDPRLPIPTLRRLAREGASATAMQPINPTVTWPNHTAMVTGVDASQHHVLFNGLVTRQADGGMTVEPWTDKDLLVQAPTVYDAAYKAGLTTAQVDWVAIYGAKTISWSFPEMPDPNGLIERELVAEGVVTGEQLANFDASSPAWQDQIRTDAAVDILRRYKPNLMLFHLLSLDDINHSYGPKGEASLEAMAFLDDRVKQITDTLQAEGLSDRATILVVSDHGFRKVQHTIYPNVALRSNGFTRVVNGKVAWDAWVVPEGGTAMVYVAKNLRRPKSLARLSSLLANLEGVERVYQPDDFARLGLALSPPSDQAPDLLLAARPGYAFGNGIRGSLLLRSNGGTHGYLNSDPEMEAIFLAWGNGIRSGIHLDRISNLDIAPTLAALLSVEMKNVTGHPLSQILDNPVR